MSYDLYLYREDKRKEPLKREELSKLDEKFAVKVIREDAEGRVLDFGVKYNDENPDWTEEEGFEIFWQDDKGCYWHYISYSADEEMFDYFRRLTEDLAETLRLTIVDPQVSNDEMDPDEFRNTAGKSDQRFEIAQQVTKVLSEKMFLYEPAQSTYFIKLFIRAWDPKASDPTMLILLEQGNQMYCSKVETGQTLDEVLKKEVPPLIGDDYYQVMTMLDGDFAFDKHGNKLPRKDVFIDIPYFDPKTRNLKYNMRWV
jgi:hypothetical protein